MSKSLPKTSKQRFCRIVLKGKVKMVRFPDVGKEVIIGIFSDRIFVIPPALDGKVSSKRHRNGRNTTFFTASRFSNLMKESREFSAIIMERMRSLRIERKRFKF